MRVRRIGVLALGILAVALAGCAGGQGANDRSAAASTSPATVASTPTPAPSETPTDPGEAAVDAMSLRDKVASLLILHAAGTDPAVLNDLVASTHPGGLILMGDNSGENVTDVAGLTAAVQTTTVPLILAVDQEGGIVRRLPGDTFPAGAQLHDLPPAATEQAFGDRAALVANAGCTLNFGVVADVTADPNSFIFSRTLGASPEAAAERVAAAVRAEAAHGVGSTLKHFPGHGAAPGDSHTSLPQTDLPLAAWRTTDAVPFAAGIDAGAPVVMFGHLIYTAVDTLPASLSPTWHRILREDLGFHGITISDDLGMLENSGDPAYADRVGNAIAALNAGTTMLLYVADGPVQVSPQALIDGIVTAVQDGRIAERTIDDAARAAMAYRLTQHGA